MSVVTPVQPEALAKKISDLLQRTGAIANPIILVRAAPTWEHGPTLQIRGQGEVRVVACESPLAIWDALATHDGQSPLAVLTDLDVQELGHGILSRVWRQRVETVQPWDLICHDFGAVEPDPALADEPWAAEALIDARPLQGWRQVAGGVLARDTALRQLAAARLGLEHINAAAEDLDVATMLRWSMAAGLPQAFQALRPAERDGLSRWLASPQQLGVVGQAVLALTAADHAADVLPLGLVCQAVWAASGEGALRARGRVEHWFGGGVSDSLVEAFAQAVSDLVASMLERARFDDRTDSAVQRILERAEQLLTQFGATEAAAAGDLLRSGLEARFTAYAVALRDGLRGRGLGPAEAAYEQISSHRLSGRAPERVRRAHMALRLARWLATSDSPPVSVGDGIDRHLDIWSWVDRATAEVWLRDDQHNDLSEVYTALYKAVAHRRKELDRAFAARLAVWTAAGPIDGLGEPLLVEQVAPKVLAPFGKVGASPLLFVVIDGMSAAVAVELAEQLADTSWTEYDPLGAKTAARRRGVVAALPTITAISRTSLFAGALAKGNQDTELRTFRAQPWWRNGAPELFHKDPTGVDDVVAAINSGTAVVAVVVNTVDEALLTGREGEEAGWDISRVGALQTLLRHARNNGRAVVITSDHGHVLERGGELRRPNEEAKARFRAGNAAPGDGEVLLVGPRVIASGNRIVAVVDEDVRYQQRRSGYHGGASLAEVTIPLLAFVPFGAAPPAGWTAIDNRPPIWWRQSAPDASTAIAAPASVSRGRTKTVPQTGEGLFDVPSPAEDNVIDALFASDLFKAQQQSTARRLEPRKVKAAVAALLDAGGTLPLAVVTERAGEAAHRATGFATTLQRLFNIDGVEVLSIIDDGRSLRLDVRLLRAQFGID